MAEPRAPKFEADYCRKQAQRLLNYAAGTADLDERRKLTLQAANWLERAEVIAATRKLPD